VGASGRGIWIALSVVALVAVLVAPSPIVRADDYCPEPNDTADRACFKCDDDNPLRSYRLVARSDNVVYLLYTWGRDAGANFNVVMDLAFKLPKHLEAGR